MANGRVELTKWLRSVAAVTRALTLRTTDVQDALLRDVPIARL